MAWSKAQESAINLTGKNILVSASAGAGKTAVLVERLKKRCLIDRIPINRIIALTFTDAAASEMKKRLSKVLNQAYVNSDDKAYIKQQLVYLQNADITTIDAYCLTIVKKYANVLGLDPEMVMNVADDATLSSIRNEAFEMTLNHYLKNNFDEIYALAQYYSPRSEDMEAFKAGVFKVISTANTAGDSNEWYKMAETRYQPIHSIREIDKETYELYKTYVTYALHTMILYCDEMENALKECEYVKDSDFENIRLIKASYEECLNKIEDYSTLTLLLENVLRKDIKNPKDAIDEFKAIKESYNSLKKDLLGKLFDSEMLVKDHNALCPLIHTLLSFSKDCADNIQSLKVKYKTIDFEDMEHFAYEILVKNNELVAHQIANAHDEIMVDEFQDTSDLQNKIVDLISNGHNTFRVGDVKQSIYRFRKAKPSLMRNMKNDKDHYEVIYFPNNFRSKENIVEFNNALFETCMNIEGCKDEYIKEDHVTIGTPSQSENKNDAIVFYQIEKEKGQSAAVLKAEFIANKITEMKEKDPSIHYGDFAVLLRNHKDKQYLKDAFEKFNLPYNVDAKNNFYESDACTMVLSFCKCLIYRDDIALLSVLTSGFYEITNDELALLKTNYDDVYTGLVKTVHPIIKDIEDLKEIYEKEGLLTCLNKMILINDFYEAKISDKEKTNFDQLFDIALKYTETSFSLEQFIHEIENMEETQTKEVTSISKDEDVVRALTIHQSKGLQYKTVFLWSNSAYRAQDTSNITLCDTEFGVALNPIEMPYRYKRTSLERIGLEHKIALEELEEYTRLLYVATTRAEERLYIVDELKEDMDDSISLATLFKRKGISGTLLASIKDNPYIRVETVSDIMYGYPNPYPRKKNVIIEHHKKIELKEMEIILPSKQHGLTPYKLKPSDPFTYGTKIHKTLEHIPFKQWDMEDFNPYELNESDIKHLMWFNKTDLFQQLCEMELHKEYPFIYVKDQKTIVNGTIDLLGIKDNKIICIDYKTNHNATKEDLLEMYQSQLALYRDCLSKAYPDHAIECLIVALSIEKIIEC